LVSVWDPRVRLGIGYPLADGRQACMVSQL